MGANSPRYRRADLLCQLHKGDQLTISQRANCSASMVSAVLNGKASQDTKLALYILRIAEYIIEKNKHKIRR